MMLSTEPRDGMRRPAVAGRFYPESHDLLADVVDAYLRHAEADEIPGIRAVVAPHAGYACSGPVAGHAFAACRPLRGTVSTVFLAGPSHWVHLDGIGLTRCRWFQTPIGAVEVNTEEVNRLLEIGDPFRLAEDAHRPEHCLEVELPFLQQVLGTFSIVPMLFGPAVDRKPLVDYLAGRMASDSSVLFVASSDLSHYLSYEEAQFKDAGFLEDVLAGDLAKVEHGEACGRAIIGLAVELAARLAWQPVLLAYANSGDTCGSRDQVVGYGAVVYTEMQQQRP